MTRRSLLAVAPAILTGAARRQPNVVIVMADDMGFSDIGCYGSEIPTPNLDRLARGGLRFTHFTNTARCCPTRASLLTGMYSHEVGIGHMVGDDGVQAYRGSLSASHATIGETMRPAGYATGVFGKWHVCPATKAHQHNWPMQRGFDAFYGLPHGGGNFFNPTMLMRGNEVLPARGDGFYFTDAVGEEAAGFVKEKAAEKKPFFAYVAPTAPHWPLHALEEDRARFVGKYREGWDACREKRYERMRKMGIVQESWGLSGRPGAIPAWEQAPNKGWHERRMEVYAAQVFALDRAVGRIVEALTAAKALDNTLLMFLSDNGGSAEINNETSGLPAYGTHTHDGKLIRRGNNPAVMPGTEDTFQSYGREWTYVSNTPFRMHKMLVHEGGISTPLVAHWPGEMKRRGELETADGHVMDLLPTVAEVGGAKLANAVSGKSLEPLLRGKARAGHEAWSRRTLFYEHEGNRAVRKQGWKLVAERGKDWELYDLKADRTEQRNLAGAQPEKVRELEVDYQAWTRRAGVMAWDEILKIRAAKRAGR